MNIFVSAIDTDAGKTMVTGLLGKALLDAGMSVVTAKLVQTGCKGIADDILVHRRLMGINPLPHDLDGRTCPYVFDYPASPHLAAQLSGTEINTAYIHSQLNALEAEFRFVITEGAGGLMVPLTPRELSIDFVAERQMPVVLVTSAKLGSINHTLLSIEAIKNRGLQLVAVVFNHYPAAPDCIQHNSGLTIRDYALSYFPNSIWLEMKVDGMDGLCNTDLLIENLIGLCGA